VSAGRLDNQYQPVRLKKSNITFAEIDLKKKKIKIAHFRVAPSLFIKARPGAQPFI